MSFAKEYGINLFKHAKLKKKYIKMNEKKNLTTKETLDLAIQNHQKNNLRVAENLYKKILEKDPNHLDSNFLLGSLSAQIRNFDLAKQLLNKAIQIEPGHANAHNNLGIVFQEIGERQRAINYFQKAIKIQPDHVNAYNNLGTVFQLLNKNVEALTYYQKAIIINPNHTDTINNLSKFLSEKERLSKDIIESNNIDLKKLYLFLFRRNYINHNDIFFITNFLFLKGESFEQIEQFLNSDSSILENKIIQALLKEELFLLLLQKSLMRDKSFEKLLTKLRYEILFTLVNSNQNILKEYFDFIVSLAEQCLLNEYVYAQSKKEINHVNQLKNKIVNNKKINEIEMGILGCYIPLYTSKNITNKLLDYKSKNILFNDLITMQIKEPLKEKELANSIKSLGKIYDKVSLKVRDQYEKNPYPRWRFTYPNIPNHFLDIFTKQIKPNKINIDNKFDNPNVLIAGCGTGQHICIAANYLNANILGIDLSIASLAFAKRKVEELGLKNIEFLQADILELNNLNKKFDVIECLGVLHHMKDILKGLKILVDLLEPHGVLQIGLYSERARQAQGIIKAREFAKKNKFENSITGIRNFREAIFNEKKDLLFQKVSKVKDFYSTSSVKDLIFHVQERCFTLPQISKILENLNLEFLNFYEPKVKNKYSILFPDDEKNSSLNNWNQFEINNPDTFLGMYKFWVRKKQKI